MMRYPLQVTIRKPKRALLLLAALAVSALLGTTSAHAALVTTNFVYGVFPNNPSISVDAIYSNASITGLGTEVVTVAELHLDMHTTAVTGLVIDTNPFSIVYSDGLPVFLDGGQFLIAGGGVGLTFTGLGTGFKRAIVRCCFTVDQRFSLVSVGPTSRVDGVVPLPAAFPLFASALAGLGIFGWRRRRADFWTGGRRGPRNGCPELLRSL